MADGFDTELTLPPALHAHRWGRVYPQHIQTCLDLMQKAMYGINSEVQVASDAVLLEIEQAYSKGYQDGLAAAAALMAQEQNGA